MDIQMILSALPGKPMGKAEPGANAGDGHFALALASASGSHPGAPSSQLPAQLPDDPRPALPPTMAAQQAMLQALSAHDPDLVADIEAAPLPDSLSLTEIMERLALIEGPAQAEGRPLADLAAPQATVAEQAARPTARAETALAAADALRQAAGEPARALETRPTGAAEAALNASLAQPQQAAGRDASETTPRATLLAQLDTGSTDRPLRAAEFARSADTAAAPPLNAGDLRGTPAEAPRPAMANIEPTSPSLQAATQPGNVAPQPMPAQASLPTPVQSQAWPGQLGQQLVQFARQGGEQQIEMKLNPAELGPLSVTLKMTEQGAQAQFLSAHAQVRQILEQAIPQLRDALAEQGISLGETSVGEQRQQEGQAFANQQGQRGDAGNQGEESLPSAAEIGMAEGATGISLDGRVNLYA